MIHQLLAWGASIIVTIGAVWKIVEKYSPKLRRALRISAEVFDLLNVLLDAVDDRKVTKQEIQHIMAEIEDLQKALEGK